MLDVKHIRIILVHMLLSMLLAIRLCFPDTNAREFCLHFNSSDVLTFIYYFHSASASVSATQHCTIALNFNFFIRHVSQNLQQNITLMNIQVSTSQNNFFYLLANFVLNDIENAGKIYNYENLRHNNINLPKSNEFHYTSCFIQPYFTLKTNHLQSK
ncbi:CLUMA_CG005645, isoform A [Clunio marinus]|uniref:CLUMA_CG005645, isoform A n=1 Tax=Clunio marinus TaxID=568069 RepID=A0A1J1I117_9DIPT|nr:CLUMA_CG005645, isoform A [Clunio marinus]